MLVMYTLNQAVSSKLPQTSLIKFIDVWIIYGLFLHFVILVLLILIEHLPDGSKVSSFEGPMKGADQDQNSKQSPKSVTKTFARRVLPILEAAFVICYFVAAFIIFNKNHG